MPTPTASIERLCAQDVPKAMELVAAANWNQTPGDWCRFIEYQPEGCFKAVLEGRLVGTVTSTCYGSELAWIGMMLVDPEQRRRGIGRQLMQRVIDYLRGQRVCTIKLDATPAGRPLYAQLEFHIEHEFQRWRRPATTPLGQADRQETCSGSCFDVERYGILDRQAFGADRRNWLLRLSQSSRVACRPEGYGMLRSGRIASYLGPITASDPKCAASIIEELLTSTSEAVIWDVPHGNALATSIAQRWQFEPVRELTRMRLGAALRQNARQYQFALGDPATG